MNRIFTRDNALLPAIVLELIIASLFATSGELDVCCPAIVVLGVAFIIWLVSRNLVQLDPDHFLVAEDRTQWQPGDWIQKKPEDGIQKGPFKIFRYNSRTWGYVWLPISYEVRGKFYAGSTPLKPFIIHGVVTADDQVAEIELNLSYRLDPRAETRWTPDQLEGRFNWKGFVRETAEKTVGRFVASLKLRDVLVHYREGLLQSELEDALNKALITTPIVVESVRVTVQKIYGEATMSKIKVTLGDGNTFYGNLVVAKSIENSFNKAAEANVSDELRDLLKQLAGAVGKMSERLPEEEAQRVARALQTLTAEATSQTPDRRWWEVSVDGLKKAAANIGEIGKPVLEIATHIAAILSGMSAS